MKTVLGTTIIIYWVFFSIICFIFYHKIFEVYYFSLFNGLYKEMLCCMLVGGLITVLALKFSTIIALVIVISAFLLTRNIQSAGLRNLTLAISVLLALFIFVLGKQFQTATSPSRSAPNSIKDAAVTQSTSTPTESVYYPNTTPEVSTSFPECLPAEMPEYTSEEPYEEEDTDLEIPYTAPDETRMNHSTSYVVGTVVNTSDGLNVRSAPGVENPIVGRIQPNTHVVIYDQVANGTTIWGKIDSGWVCMDYITLSPVERESTSSYNNQYPDVCDIGYVVADGGLKVRSGPGTMYGEIARLANGERVSIFEYQHDGYYNWGRIDRGWICTDYISYVQPSGTCYMEDVPEDVLLRYEGKWGDRVGQRCSVDIWYGLTAFSIEMRWGSSASQSTEWSFTGVYDESSDSLTYSNGKCVERTYHDGGGVSEKIRYSNGSGRFYISGGELYWEDDTEGAGSGCIFQKLQ